MKNFAIAALRLLRRFLGRHRLFGGVHDCARPGLLEALDNDPLSGFYAVNNDVVGSDAVAEGDAADGDLIVGADCVYDLRALNLGDGLLRNEEGVLGHSGRESDAAELSRSHQSL